MGDGACALWLAIIVASAEHGSADVALAGPAGSPGPATAAPATNEAASSKHEGEKTLELARQQLRAAESAQDEAQQRQHYARASELAERATELLPSSADARFVHFAARGRLAQLDGFPSVLMASPGLRRELDEILRLNPNHADALAARGGARVKLPALLGGDTKEGIRDLERAVSLDDHSVGKRLELAEAYHAVGRDEDALRLARAALAQAKERGNPERIAKCERLIAELERACETCAARAAKP